MSELGKEEFRKYIVLYPVNRDVFTRYTVSNGLNAMNDILFLVEGNAVHAEYCEEECSQKRVVLHVMCPFQYEVMPHMAYCLCEGDCFADCSLQNDERKETIPMVNKDAVCASGILCQKGKCVIWH
jgi:hypothetical protein